MNSTKPEVYTAHRAEYIGRL